MPGPYIHMSSMRHAASQLAANGYQVVGSSRINPAWTGPDVRNLGAIMQKHPNFASLGAIGPDMFFFLADFRDLPVGCQRINISSILITVLDFLEKLYADLDPFITQYEKYLGPITENLAEEMSRLTGGLSETVGNILGDIVNVLITDLEVYVTGLYDWWEYFSLGLDEGFDEQAYLWSDMLHYRATGNFARNLWKNANVSAKASGNDAVLAYALGYITHVATDVTGHPFVNSVVGGPFRLHWQRHHLVENHMDALWYLNDPTAPRFVNPSCSNGSPVDYPQLTESALYFDIAFEDGTGNPVMRPPYCTGNTLREGWQRRRDLDKDSKLPDPLPDLLRQTMFDTWYPDNLVPPAHPLILDPTDGRPQAKQIQEAYDLLYRYLKFATVDGFSHEPPDPPAVFPNLDFPAIPDLGPAPGASDGGFWNDVLDFILAVVSVLLFIVQVAVYLATLPWAIAADVLTEPWRLAAYYAFEVPLFQMLKAFRNGLVMTGYMLPMEDEVASILVHIGNTEPNTFSQVLDLDGDVFGGLRPPKSGPIETFHDPLYPHSIPLDPKGHTSEFRTPWRYPASVREMHDPGTDLPTIAGPYAAGSDPSVLFGNVDADSEIRDRLDLAVDPGQADSAGNAVTPRRYLGDADIFSKYLIWLETRDPVQADGTRVPVVDWNLDSDMGYGYHAWDWLRSTAQLGGPQPDPNGNTFFQPCTWPPQANSSLDFAAPTSWDWRTPLKLRWWSRTTGDNCGVNFELKKGPK
jgi:hypothetical protein